MCSRFFSALNSIDAHLSKSGTCGTEANQGLVQGLNVAEDSGRQMSTAVGK